MHESGLVRTDTDNSLGIPTEKESSYCFVQHFPQQHAISLSSELTKGWGGHQKPWDETGLQDLRGGVGQRVWHSSQGMHHMVCVHPTVFQQYALTHLEVPPLYPDSLCRRVTWSKQVCQNLVLRLAKLPRAQSLLQSSFCRIQADMLSMQTQNKMYYLAIVNLHIQHCHVLAFSL